MGGVEVKCYFCLYVELVEMMISGGATHSGCQINSPKEWTEE